MEGNSDLQKFNLSGKQANELSTDFCMEVVVASLIEQGYASDLIRVVREGMARRGISKDIESISQQYVADELQDYLSIKTNREGFYDMLPEGLFHQPIRNRPNPDKEDIMDEIRIHRQEEFFARKFFHIFEQESDKRVVDAYLFEAKLDRKNSNREYIGLFEHYWPVLKELSHKQAILFMHIIPIMYHIRINYSQTAQALSLILDVPVRITPVKLPAKQAERYFQSKVGANEAGVDFVLGNTFDDGWYDLKLTIGPISGNRMRGFLETAKDYLILEELCLLFLPADLFIVKEFIINPEDSEFILSDEKHETFLGINSFI